MTDNRPPDNMTTTTVLSERCPKCGQQMFNHPRSLTRCAKCGHEWSMKEPGVPPTSKERSLPERLRTAAATRAPHDICTLLCAEAAKEIERLRRELDDARCIAAELTEARKFDGSDHWSRISGDWAMRCGKMQTERDRLRAALEKAADTFHDLGRGLHLVGRPLLAQACEVAEKASREALGGEPVAAVEPPSAAPYDPCAPRTDERERMGWWPREA